MFIISKASLPTASLPAVSLPIAAIGTPVPGAPTSLIATNGAGDAIDLAWTAPTGEPVTGYNVYRAISGSGSYTRIASTVAPTVTYTDSTSVSGTTYDYYVTATNPGGESGASNVETITALVVDQVTGLSINLVDNTGVLTWDAVSGADGYEVERSPTGAGTWTQIDDVAGATATDTYTVADAGYDYRVRAYIGVNFGEYSTAVTAYSPLLYDDFDRSVADLKTTDPTLGAVYDQGISGGSTVVEDNLSAHTTSGGQARNATTNNNDHAVQSDTGQSEIVLFATGVKMATGSSLYLSIRTTDAENSGYSAVIVSNAFYIFRWDNGSATTVASKVQTAGYFNNRSFNIELRATGTTIRAIMTGDRSEDIQATGQTNHQTNTGVGFGVRYTTNTTGAWISKVRAVRG
jgi:hypothetical protein